MYTRENRYYKHSKVSEYQFRRILKGFAQDFTATDTAKMTGVSTRSINTIFIKIRYRLAEYCEANAPLPQKAGAEMEEAAPRQMNGTDNALPEVQHMLFGLVYRGGSVYIEALPLSIKPHIIQVLRSNGALEDPRDFSRLPAYDGILDLGAKKYFRIPLHQEQWAAHPPRSNGAESFWAYTRRRMSKFKGLRKQMFYLHLKETEFRFNHRHANLYNTLLRLLRKHPI